MSDIPKDNEREVHIIPLVHVPHAITEERITVRFDDYTVLRREHLIKDNKWIGAGFFLIPRECVPELVKLLKENYPQMFKEQL